MIVKVQTSLSTSEECPQVLVYNEDRSVMWQGPVDDSVFDLMDGEQKKFFQAHVGQDGKVVLDNEVLDQDW